MIKITMDNWRHSGEIEKFTLFVQCIPNVGERMLIDKNLMPPEWFDGPDGARIDDSHAHEDEAFEAVEVEICGIRHIVAHGEHKIDVGFDIVNYKDGSTDLDQTAPR